MASTSDANIYNDIEDLLKQIPDTEENKSKLIAVRTKLNSIQKYEESNNFLKEKTIMAFSLLSFIKTICKCEPKIYGSFVRQYFECCYANNIFWKRILTEKVDSGDNMKIELGKLESEINLLMSYYTIVYDKNKVSYDNHLDYYSDIISLFVESDQ